MNDKLRFPALTPDNMTPEQRKLFDDIASGPRGGVNGPFEPLLYNPELGRLVQNLGEFLRFRSRLSPPLFELCVLVAARHWSCQYEWYMHGRLADKVGLPPAIIEAIREGRVPPEMSADEKLVYDVCTETHRNGRLSDELFNRAEERFGREGVLELLACCGYYSLLAFVLNVSDDPLPNDAPPPLK